MKTFGESLRERRIKQKLTLRKFCEKTGYDAAYISRLERSTLTAPQNKGDLIQLLNAYGLLENSKNWNVFIRLARETMMPY